MTKESSSMPVRLLLLCSLLIAGVDISQAFTPRSLLNGPTQSHSRSPRSVSSISRLNVHPGDIDPATAETIISTTVHHGKTLLDSLQTSLIIGDESSNVVSSAAPYWGLFGNQFTGPGWLGWLDISRFPFLDANLRAGLSSFPSFLRLAMGFLTIDFVPIVVDVLILKFLWGTLINADLSKIDTSPLPNTYNQTAIAEFYRQQPGIVLTRTLEMAKEFRAFVTGVLMDIYKDEVEQNMPIRAKEFGRLVPALGPAFIKVGQSVSLRPDICPPAYLEELTKLQDQVPPFDSKVALDIIEAEIKGPASTVFEDVSVFDEPLAAASLGQVYRAKLKSTGEDVAVKVQRPNVKLIVTLDLFIVRGLLSLTSNSLKDVLPGPAESCGALVGAIDAWAGRFVDELDYRKEIENCERFRNEMGESDVTLGDAIVVPKPDLELSSDRILVSEWVDGTKLSKIDTKSEGGKAIVRKLTRVLLNAYLVQLLETGFLHADPHPGNFLVTSEGKLCILDYGLMTEISEDRQIALLEYVCHLLAKDFDASLDDLAVLGFVPEIVTTDPKLRSLIAPIMADVMTQLSDGGGAGNMRVDIKDVGEELEDLAKKYPIKMPEYFGLIVRAFGALEGLGLSVDRDYSIVAECFPYMAKRMLSDDSERLRGVLKTFLYGTKGRFDVSRLDEIAEAYGKFSQTATDAASGKTFEELRFQSDTVTSRQESFKEQPAIDPVVSSAVRILFSAQGNYVQQLIVEEAVRITEALSRSAINTAASIPTNLLSLTDTVIDTVNPFSKPKEQQPTEGLTVYRSTMQGRQVRITDIMNPLFPISVVADSAARTFGPSAEDLESLKTLKRLLQILAGVEKNEETQQKINKIQTDGLLSLDDLSLVAQILGRAASTVTSTASSLVLPSAESVIPMILLPGPRERKLQLLTKQLVELFPLVLDSAPGATNLALLFTRKIISRSLNGVADTFDKKDPVDVQQKALPKEVKPVANLPGQSAAEASDAGQKQGK